MPSSRCLVIMKFLVKALLLIYSTESTCDLRWKGQKTKPVEKADFFKEQIPIYWKRMVGNSRCIVQIKVEQKRKNETKKISDIYRSQLKNYGGKPFKVTNKFGDCTSASYAIKIEVTDDQLKQYEITTIMNPVEMLNQFDETKSVKTVQTRGGFSLFWKEGGMFAKSPLLVNCISGAEIYHRSKDLRKMINTENEKVRVPPRDLSVCERYEVRYHFFTQQPKMKQAFFTYPSKKHCENGTQEAKVESRRRIPNCDMVWNANAASLFHPEGFLDGHLRIFWEEIVTFPPCVKKIEYKVVSGASVYEETINPIGGKGPIPPMSNFSQCQPMHLSLKITDTSTTEALDKVIDPIDIFFNSDESLDKVVKYNETKRYDLISEMFKNDKLREFCLEAIDIFDAKNQKQRSVSKDKANEAQIKSDPCSNTNVTLLYKFKGPRNVSVRLEIQGKPNCTPVSLKTELILSMGGLGAVVLIITIGVTILIKRRKKTNVPQQADIDINPVYGTYSRGSMDEGEYGDGDLVEAVDFNPVYGTYNRGSMDEGDYGDDDQAQVVDKNEYYE